MSRKTIKEMLGDLPVGEVDVVRLFVEMAEEWGLPRETKGGLISEFRRMVKIGLQARRELERTLAFGEVVERSLAARSGRRKSTVADLRSYAGRMVRHGDWKGRPLRGIRVEDCREMLQEVFGHSPHAYRKARSILHSIFSYGEKQGWCDKNPVDAIEVPRTVERRINPLTLPDIRRLMGACQAPDMKDMAPAVSLMLWCGVRPGEIQRLTWGDVNTDEGIVYVDPENSKTGGARLIPLRGGAARILERTEKALNPSRIQQRIAPRNWAKRWRLLRQRAGFVLWQQDALRHTFASMHLLSFRNPPSLQAEMGHRDSTLLRTRYVNLRGMTQQTADLFWSPRMLASRT